MGSHPIRVEVGHKCGKLTVVSEIYKGAKQSYSVDCLCECGNVVEVSTRSLREKTTTCCWDCCCRGRLKVKVGDQFGNLTVTGLSKRGEDRWPVRCKCGEEYVVTGARLKAGGGCKQCAYLKRRQAHKAAHWKRIVAQAVLRNIEVTVTWEEIEALLIAQGYRCALTGLFICLADTSNNHISGCTSASLDRIDSTKGYVSGNVQWIHKEINRFKNRYSEPEFITMCRLVAEHLGGMVDKPSPESKPPTQAPVGQAGAETQQPIPN